MKYRHFVPVLFLPLLIGCVDYASESTINISNNSQYNLRLTFIHNIQLTDYDPDYYEPFDIDVENHSEFSYRLFGGLGSTIAPDPNWEYARIILYNPDNEIVLNEIEICDFATIINNIFQFIETKDHKHFQEAVYLLEITDELLKQ